MLVSYFKAGLENNEFCLLLTSAPLDENNFKDAMRKAVPRFERYMQDRQFEIVTHGEFIHGDKTFNLQRILQRWIEKLDHALARGYDGMRVAGNPEWFEKPGWINFAYFEDALDGFIEKHKMLVLCIYTLDKRYAEEVLDVTQSHQFTLVERSGTWERIERTAEFRLDQGATSGQTSSLHLLSKRERDVFELIALGHTNKEAADRLNLSVKTIETYRLRMLEKLVLKTRADLVRYALASGVLKPKLAI